MRTTPISKDLPSPFEILNGRPGRTINWQAQPTAVTMQKWSKNFRRLQSTTINDMQLENFLCYMKTKMYLFSIEQATGSLQQSSKMDLSPWSPEAHITADVETAYFAATQGLQMLGTEPALPTAVRVLVAQPEAAPVPPAAAGQVTDREDKKTTRVTSVTLRERAMLRSHSLLLMSKLPVWCLQRHQIIAQVQILTLEEKKIALVKINNLGGAGGREGPEFATNHFKGRAKSSRRTRLSDSKSKTHHSLMCLQSWTHFHLFFIFYRTLLFFFSTKHSYPPYGLC